MLRIFWFRKDLRINDNCGLYNFIDEVKEGDEVLFLYIKNRNTYKFFGKKRIQFLNECLAELQEELNQKGFKLNILCGSSPDIFRKILETTGTAIIYANEQPEPYSRQRDENVGKLCESYGSRLKLFTDSTLFELGAIRKSDGKPFVMFTPFNNKASGLLDSEYYKSYGCDLSSLKSSKEPVLVGFTEADLDTAAEASIFIGGRKEGLKELKSFYERRLNEYKSRRDFPAVNGTSKLSPHLHFGTVGIREAVRTAFIKMKKVSQSSEKLEAGTWIKELLWREFYYNISFHFPYITGESFQKKYDKLKWNMNEKMFTAWKEGKTGYPIVDAGMRQLNTEGWMHNRVRMITAMFLTKHLLIDWRKGERYFAESLVDMDFSNNNGGWQWSASTGVDAQPYFRIFNPVLQSKKFDPEGEYIRKYVPELEALPKKYIHEPWIISKEEQTKYNITIGESYPAPVVNHKEAREIAIKEYGSITKDN